MLRTFSNLLLDMNDTQQLRGNDKFQNLVDYVGGTAIQRLNRTAVDLTVAAQTPLITVPTGYKAVVHGVKLIGKTAQTGANKNSIIQVGTTANSYAELLDTGHNIQVGFNQSLIPVANHLDFFWNRRVPRLISRTLVDLTVAASTALYTVPAGANLRVTNVILEGQTTMSGGTSSKLLIGTSANSDVELLNGSTGVTFISGTATSLLAAGARIDASNSLALPTTMSLAMAPDFAAAAAIRATVSGTVVTAGKVYVELWGMLDTDGPKEFAAGSIIQASVSGTVVTAGAAWVELFGRYIASEA